MADYKIVDEDEVVFDPKIHLKYSPPEKRFTIEDLLLQPTSSTPRYVGTTPFPLLSDAGIIAYRKALFEAQLLCKCSTLLYGTMMVRDLERHSPFIRDFWAHSETNRIIADAAGVELVPLIEIAHTNVQIKGATIEQKARNLNVEPVAQTIDPTAAEEAFDPLATTVIPWHNDSFPFVCVLMLSNTQGMLGGETYIKKGDGTAFKVENPKIGHGVILNGGEVQHLAARAHGVDERITTITSYIQRIPSLYDDSYLGRQRPLTKVLPEMYTEWAQYQLKRMRLQIQIMEANINRDGIVDVAEFEEFAINQENYMKRTRRQMVDVDFHRETISKFSIDTYFSTAKMIKAVRDDPTYLELAGSMSQENWLSDNDIWLDLIKTRQDILAGKQIESQDGRFSWNANDNHLYTIGDELIRQGLYEFFLQWFEGTGLFDLYRYVDKA